MNRTNMTWRSSLVPALLALAALVAFLPVLRSDFIRLDDPMYVVRNPHVNTGLSWDNMCWAFQAGYEGNWHPVTWLSHMLDVTLFGLRPGWHHLVNLLLHIANTLLLLLWLRRLTNALWASAAVAALFAVHPLHVESVAWVAERKDVLSTFFFLLTLIAYSRYSTGIRGPGGEAPIAQSGEPPAPHPALLSGSLGQERGHSCPPCAGGHPCGQECPRSGGPLYDPAAFLGSPLFYYLLALFCFVLGLMSKQMLVTLPFVLLLVDYWPLGRVDLAKTRRLPARLSRLLLEKAPFFCLAGLASVITFQVQQKAQDSGLVLPLASRLANALVSYVKYLGKTFWPADLAVFYPHPDLNYPVSHQWPGWAVLAAAVLLGSISILALVRLKRVPWLAVGWFWFLGTLVPVIGLVQVGRQGMADRYAYIPSIGLFVCLVWGAAELLGRLCPGPGSVRPVDGSLPSSGEGFGRCRPAVILGGALAAVSCLIVTRVQVGYWRDNTTLFTHALAVTKHNALAHFHVGTGLGELEQFNLAKEHFMAATQADPSFPPPYYSLGLILAAQDKPVEAIASFRQAIRLKPDWVTPLDQLAWLLATHPRAEVRDGPEAVRLAERACALTGGQSPRCWGTLDAAYAETGRYADAIRTAEKALALAQSSGQTNLAQAVRQRLGLYRRQQPYRAAP